MDYIFGMLFLKRMNDEFSAERSIREKEFKEQGMVEEEVEELLNDSSIYETFYVPEQARWANLKNLNLNIGLIFDSMNLSNEYIESEDILGNAYEYLIKQFADEGGKEGGEFYI